MTQPHANELPSEREKELLAAFLQWLEDYASPYWQEFYHDSLHGLLATLTDPAASPEARNTARQNVAVLTGGENAPRHASSHLWAMLLKIVDAPTAQSEESDIGLRLRAVELIFACGSVAHRCSAIVPLMLDRARTSPFPQVRMAICVGLGHDLHTLLHDDRYSGLKLKQGLRPGQAIWQTIKQLVELAYDDGVDMEGRQALQDVLDSCPTSSTRGVDKVLRHLLDKRQLKSA